MGVVLNRDSGGSAEVERLCDDVVMMKKGRIVDRGTPADLIARYDRSDLEEVFLDVARGLGEAASHVRERTAP